VRWGDWQPADYLDKLKSSIFDFVIAASLISPLVVLDMLTLPVMAAVNRLFSPDAAAQVRNSANLFNWSPWDVSGNNDFPEAVNFQSMQGPTANGTMFVRLILNQR
jgi:hypothetical protein